MKLQYKKLSLAAAISLALTACGGGGGGDTPLPVNSPSEISGVPATSVDEGVTYSFTPSASDTDSDTLTFSAQNLPSWASLDTATGMISGQPSFADVGVSSAITLSVNDGQASVSLPAFTITVAAKVGLKGKVVDGYISGSTVFLDKNRNGVLDVGEPSALSDDTGAYRLPLSDADIAALPTSPVVVLVGAGAVDISTGEEFTEDNDLVLTTPPILDFDLEQAESFSQAITPFTTELYDEVKATLDLVVSGDLPANALTFAIDAAKSTVLEKTAADLDIDIDKLKDLLFADFLDPTAEVGLELVKLNELADHAVSTTDDLQESQKLAGEVASSLEDNQEVLARVKKYSFTDWHTLEIVFIKEVSKEITTTADSGDKVIEWEATKYRLNADGTQMEIGGEPLIYEIVSVTESKKVDGTFEAEVKYEIDRNGDNERLFKGKSYKQGTWTATTTTYFEYFDESKPSVEAPEIA